MQHHPVKAVSHTATSCDEKSGSDTQTIELSSKGVELTRLSKASSVPPLLFYCVIGFPILGPLCYVHWELENCHIHAVNKYMAMCEETCVQLLLPRPFSSVSTDHATLATVA